MYIRKIIEDTYMQVVMKHSKSHIKKRLLAQITKTISVLFHRRLILNQHYSYFFTVWNRRYTLKCLYMLSYKKVYEIFTFHFTIFIIN